MATGYVIRTPNGEKGPFTAEQIRAFADQGKLPMAAKIKDAATNAVVTVQEVCEQVPAAVGFAEDPAPAAKPATGRKRATARHSRTGTGRATRGGRAAGEAEGEEGEQRPTARHRRGKKGFFTGPMIAMIAAVVIGVIVLIVAMVQANTLPPPRIAGGAWTSEEKFDIAPPAPPAPPADAKPADAPAGDAAPAADATAQADAPAPKAKKEKPAPPPPPPPAPRPAQFKFGPTRIVTSIGPEDADGTWVLVNHSKQHVTLQITMNGAKEYFEGEWLEYDTKMKATWKGKTYTLTKTAQ